MKRGFKLYLLIWALLLVAFSAVVFLVRPVLPGYVISYDVRFWIALTFIVAAFVGNLICARIAFKSENLQKKFYNISLVSVSWTAAVIIAVLGAALMLIPGCPAWVAAAVCVVAFALNAIAVLKAVWASGEVQRIDEKVKAQTAFIKNLTVDAESILARAKSEAVKADCKKVYEAVRYSDPMSSEALSVIEAKITAKLDELSSAVAADDAEKVKEIANDLVLLVGGRNKKCKALK